MLKQVISFVSVVGACLCAFGCGGTGSGPAPLPGRSTAMIGHWVGPCAGLSLGSGATCVIDVAQDYSFSFSALGNIDYDGTGQITQSAGISNSIVYFNSPQLGTLHSDGTGGQLVITSAGHLDGSLRFGIGNLSIDLSKH